MGNHYIAETEQLNLYITAKRARKQEELAERIKNIQKSSKGRPIGKGKDFFCNTSLFLNQGNLRHLELNLNNFHDP